MSASSQVNIPEEYSFSGHIGLKDMLDIKPLPILRFVFPYFQICTLFW